ncbi:MAG: hypothetical protein GY694_08280, partial [Gammaproteobacteria bacterium]|nr:hypothetical protein [Gammaproteobacteria bacterium]
MSNGLIKFESWFKGFTLCALLALSAVSVADEVLVYYIDDAGEAQILTSDANSSEEDNALAAELILEHSKILVI